MKKRRGVTLLELLVAMIVMMVGIFVVFNLFPRAFSIAYKSRAREIAYQLARTKIERLFAQQLNASCPIGDGSHTTGEEFLSTFDGSGTGNSNAADSEDTMYTLYNTDKDAISNDDYKSFESDYYGDVLGSNLYYYRIELNTVTDPHYLYLDQITRRFTMYVSIPPIVPTDDSTGWGGGFAAEEQAEISRGNIVVVAVIRTNRRMAATLSQAASNGDYKIYVNSREESFLFPIFYSASRSAQPSGDTHIAKGGGGYYDDLDFADVYTKELNGSGSSCSYGADDGMSYGGISTGGSTGRAIYDTIRGVGSKLYMYPSSLNSNTTSHFLFSGSKDYLYDSGTRYGPNQNRPCDPQNFSAFISSGDNREAIQVVGRGNDATGYYLQLGGPIRCAPDGDSVTDDDWDTAGQSYPSGTQIYSWIYILMND